MKMATLDMGKSYPLTQEVIDCIVGKGKIGNYAYGYLNEEGSFIVRYVGRSDTDLQERIKHGIEDMRTDPSCRYERFKFSYANSILEAYEKECQNYHDFGVTEGRFLCHDSAPELLHISRVLRNFVTNLYIAMVLVITEFASIK